MAQGQTNIPESIQSSPVSAEWADRLIKVGNGRPMFGNWVSLELPGPDPLVPPAQFINNEVYADGDARVMEAGSLVVRPEFRGGGLGERLTKSLGALAADHGCERIETEVRSEFALDIFERVFGADRIRFYTKEPKTAAKTELPITVAESREILAGYGARETNLEKRRQGIEVSVDLAGIDMTGWERPEEQGTELVEL